MKTVVPLKEYEWISRKRPWHSAQFEEDGKNKCGEFENAHRTRICACFCHWNTVMSVYYLISSSGRMTNDSESFCWHCQVAFRDLFFHIFSSSSFHNQIICYPVLIRHEIVGFHNEMRCITNFQKNFSLAQINHSHNRSHKFTKVDYKFHRVEFVWLTVGERECEKRLLLIWWSAFSVKENFK